MNEYVSMDKVIIRKLTDIIHANLDKENFGVNELAIAAGMSRFTLHRRLKTYLKKSASQFIREVRLEKALEMLEQDVATAAEISYMVGFNSPTYFNSCFHQYFGFTPGEAKKRILTETVHIRRIENQEAADTELKPIQKVKLSRITIGITLAVLLILTIIFLRVVIFDKVNRVEPGSLKSNEKSIAVLPFKNLSGNPENQFFADGVMEDILNHLLRINEIRVVSRTTAEHYRATKMTAPQIAKKLKVNFILEGSAQQYEGKVRINVQLIDARIDQHLWAEKYESNLSDIFVIQSSIAKQIADKLQTVLLATEIEYIDKIPTMFPEAYTFYLKGRYFWNRRTEEGLKKSLRYFEKALVADPNYALAIAGLADAYFMLSFYGWMPHIEGFAKTKSLLLSALKLDKNLSEAHATMGALLCRSEWKWEEACKEFLLAIELNPKNTVARQYYAEFLDITGANKDAREQLNCALDLDPFSPVLYALSANCFYHEGKFDESLEDCQKVEELDPDSDDIYWKTFLIYIWQSKETKAVEALKQHMSRKKTFTAKDAVNLDQVFLQSKINGVLKWLIESESIKSHPDALALAKYCVIQGKKMEALNWIETALKKRLPGISGIYNDPDFENLRREIRYKAVIKKLGLSDYGNTIAVHLN